MRGYWDVMRSESSALLVPHDAASDVDVYFAAAADHTYDMIYIHTYIHKHAHTHTHTRTHIHVYIFTYVAGTPFNNGPHDMAAIMSYNSHEFELHRPSNKGTKLLLKVIKAIIIV